MTDSSVNDTSASQDFLDLYIHAAGTSETPALFHFWCGLSIIAACVKDQVWYEKFAGSKLVPNLYVILLGESGSGKGRAIHNLEDMIKVEVPPKRPNDPPDYAVIPQLNHFNGTITASFLTKLLSVRRSLYLILPELSQSLTDRNLANWFIRTMCELSETKVSHVDGTRKHGYQEIKHQCINWMAGTTRDWLIESVPQSSIRGGFIGRCVVIEGDRKGERIWKPVYPSDRVEVVDYLKKVILWYTTLRGEFKYSAGAEKTQEAWYYNRPDEDNPSLRPSWLREDDLVYKLSMLFALSDLPRLDESRLVVQAVHVKAAINTISDMWKPVEELVESSERSQHPYAKGFQTMRNVLMQHPANKHKQIKKSDLSHHMSARGYLEKQRSEFMYELVHVTKEVEVSQTATGGIMYAWIGKMERKKK